MKPAELSEREKKEHKRNVEECKSGSNIAKNAWTQDHNFNFDTCKILDKATYRHRATLKSWHTATTMNSNNNAQHLLKGTNHSLNFIFLRTPAIY